MCTMKFAKRHFGKLSFLVPMFVVTLGACLETAADDPVAATEAGQKYADVIRVPSAVVKIADSVDVPAEYAGVLTNVHVREGQFVQKGESIAKIKDSELRLRLIRAKYENQIANLTAENDVDIRYSEKSREVAESEVDRSNRANAKVANSVPAARLERQILEKDRTILQLEQAKRDFTIAQMKTNLTKTELELSQVLLEKTEINSPMDGMIAAVERHEGEWVEPSETVVRVVRVDRLRVEGFVSAAQAGKIKIGSPVEVKFSQDWLKGRTFKGSVVFVSPQANPVNSEILVWAEIQNEHNDLLPGLRGEIVIFANDASQNAKL